MRLSTRGYESLTFDELRQSILLTCCITARNRLRKPARPKYKSLNATEPKIEPYEDGRVSAFVNELDYL